MAEPKTPKYEECKCTAQLESSCKYMMVTTKNRLPKFYCLLQPKPKLEQKSRSGGT